MVRKIIYTSLIVLLLLFCVIVGFSSYQYLTKDDTKGAAASEEKQEEVTSTETEEVSTEQTVDPAIVQRLQAGDINRGDLKIAFLTFDDGPNDCTEEVLQILKDHDVKATFFTNGRPGYEALYKRIVEDGHVLANHTYSHDYSLYNDTNAFLADVQKQEDFIRAATGTEPVKIFRFPGGSNNTNQTNVDALVASGYSYFDWDASAGDGSSIPLSPQDTYAKIVTEVREHPVAVILCHGENPEKVSTRGALDGVITTLKDEGYTFMTLDPSYNLTKFMN